MTPTIDRTRYFFIPRTSGRRLLSLGRLLGKYQPPQASAELEDAGKQLTETVAQVSHAFVERHREYGVSIAADEQEVDGVMDALWHILHDRTTHWEVFSRPGMQRLFAQPPQSVDMVDWQDKAAEARKVRVLLFEPGLEFLRAPYAEQAEHMRTLWTVVEEEKLEPALRELIGDEFVEAVLTWRGKYDEMLERRTARARGSSINLREQTLRLSRVIQNYVIALLAMIRDEDPENVEMIRNALRPIDALREQLDRERARPRGGDVANENADVDEGVIDELIAEQQAIDAELGLGSEAATEPSAVAS